MTSANTGLTWPRGTRGKQLFAWEVRFLLESHWFRFIHLPAPWLPLHVYNPSPFLSFIIHRQQLVFLKLCLPPRFTSRHPATDWSLKKDLRHLLLKGYVHCQGGICLRACSTLCSDRIWSWVETTSMRRSLRGKPAGKLIDRRNSGGIVCSFAALCERMSAFIVATKGTRLKWVTVLDSARKESENGQEAIIKEKRYKCR